MIFSSILFWFLLTALFLIDGFSLFPEIRLSFFLLILTPLLLYKKFSLPKKTSLLYLIFLAISFISVFFAIDKQIAFEQWLVYLSLYFVFLYAYNFKNEIIKILPQFIKGISLFFLLTFLINKFSGLRLFDSPTSLFYHGHLHNQLGNLLVLGLLSAKEITLFFLFSLAIVFSYSRAAYFNLFVFSPVIIGRFFHNKKIFTYIFSILFFLLIVLTSKNIILTSKKAIFGLRDKYFYSSLRTIKKHPFFGVGAWNYYLSTLQNKVKQGENSSASHNLILEILAENGLIAGLFFILFLIFSFKGSIKSTSYLLFALTSFFLVDFSYIYTSFLVLWFVLLGLNCEEKLDFATKKDLVLIIFSIIISQIVILSELCLLVGLNNLSLHIYPLQKQAYVKMIEGKIDRKYYQEAYYYIDRYDKLFSNNFGVLEQIADYYFRLGDEKKELILYKRIIDLYPYWFNYNKDRVLASFVANYGQTKANSYFKNYMLTIEKKYKIDYNFLTR